jgi:hypothetical protein
MQVTYDSKAKELVIRIKAGTPKQSASGRTMLIASETAKDAVEVEGKSTTIAINAYFRP